MSTMVPKFKFTEGEKVLCFHGPLLYEAKCIKSQVKDKLVKYFIHYSGWNKNWDEWVPESRVLKFNDGNLQKQKELEKAHVKTKKAKTPKVAPKKDASEKEGTPTPQEKPKQKSAAPSPVPAVETSPSEGQRKKRMKVEQNVETEEEFVQKIEVKVRIPHELKIWLVDDWDLVTRQKKLLHLPARTTIEHMLRKFVKYKIAEKGTTLNKEVAVMEITNGIREYFNKMLGKQLLYPFERPQYQKMLSEYPDKTMCEIYGPIHLLRLFSRIGTVLAYTPLDDETMTLLMNHCQEFVKFMSKPSQSCLSLNDYSVASPEYRRKAV